MIPPPISFEESSELRESELRNRPKEAAFLTVPELAQLLHVNEKKIYQLAGCGEIPGTKVTGKWIFPRRLIDDWLMENSHGGVMHDRLLIAGSDDRLLHQICNRAAIDWQQQALISYSPSGTRHGLKMLDSGRVDACFMNWGASEESARRHLGLLRCYKNHSSWVIVRCIQRRQGLALGKHANLQQTSPNDENLSQLISNTSLRWAMRQNDSGTERLVQDLCSTYGQNISQLSVSANCNSELGAIAAVNTARADICCTVQSIASEFNLEFVGAADVSLDLVMTRKTYFRSLMQDFIDRLHNENTMALASVLGGYQLMPIPELVTVDRA